MRLRPFLLVVVAGLVASACADDAVGPPRQVVEPTPPPPDIGQGTIQHPFADRQTPFQRNLARYIAERRAAGLSVPDSVAFTFDDRAAIRRSGVPRLERDAPVGPGVTAVTTVRFASPEQAGLNQWPAIEVRGSMPEGATGFIHEGDYTASIKQQIAQQYPNTNVDFDTGERTYTITETIADGPPQAPSLLGLTDREVMNLTSSSGMLMGFTVNGPAIDYHIEYNLNVCIIWFFGCVVEWEIVDFWAGFVLDWTIMTRLPMDVRLTSVDSIPEGSSFSPITAATGLDWGAADYTQAGLAAEDGNEFVLRFRFGLGVFLTVSYVPVVNWGIPPINIDRVASFATPLGTGQMFALPSLNISLWNLNVAVAAADFGVQLTPLAGSERFTAQWAATGNGSGSGNVTYTTSGQNVALGAVSAADGPGSASVALSSFRYHFTQFGLDIGLYFYLMVAGWSHTWPIPVTQFSLSGLMGGPYVGTHSGTPGTHTLNVPVTNVKPTAAISRAGTIVRVRPLFLVEHGGPLTFTADAADPGKDDLTLTWQWSDRPTPDVTTYPVPHAVREIRTHQFPGACLHEVSFSVRDDDGATARDVLHVVSTGAASNPVRPLDYWIGEYQAAAPGLGGATLQCYLEVASAMSEYFGEKRSATRTALALDILLLQGPFPEVRKPLDRALLVAWLNFAHGGIEWRELVDTDGDLVPDRAFADVITEAEYVRRNTNALEARTQQVTAWLENAVRTAAQ